MSTIRYFKLKNTGAFVARMKVLWWHDDASGFYEPEGYHDICAHAERTLDMVEHIPDGAEVQLKACVVAGKDKTADEKFTFKADASDTASYHISGTTLINKLVKE